MNYANYSVDIITGTTNSQETKKANSSKPPDTTRARFKLALAGYFTVQEKPKTTAMQAKNGNGLSMKQMADKMRTENAAMRLRMLTEVLQKDKSKTTSNQYDAQIKCSIIATRIMRGDKVSDQDLRFLMEHDPHLYFIAIMSRVEKEDPEEYESITDDEEGDADASSDSCDAAASCPSDAGASAASALAI